MRKCDVVASRAKCVVRGVAVVGALWSFRLTPPQKAKDRNLSASFSLRGRRSPQAAGKFSDRDAHMCVRVQAGALGSREALCRRHPILSSAHCAAAARRLPSMTGLAHRRPAPRLEMLRAPHRAFVWVLWPRNFNIFSWSYSFRAGAAHMPSV